MRSAESMRPGPGRQIRKPACPVSMSLTGIPLAPNASTVTGTVPASLSSVEPRIRHAIAQQLSAPAKAGKATIKWSRQEGSHDYFTYGPQSPEQGLSATMTDPVMIRVPLRTIVRR